METEEAPGICRKLSQTIQQLLRREETPLDEEEEYSAEDFSVLRINLKQSRKTRTMKMKKMISLPAFWIMAELWKRMMRKKNSGEEEQSEKFIETIQPEEGSE